LNTPNGVAVDSAGNLYIADLKNCRIREVSNGTITTVAGIGAWGYNGDNGPATSAWLKFPAGVAVDSAGDLYIADH
jgi:DNA-binding beta-propeller fold protein YncE